MSQHGADVRTASPPTHRRNLLIGVTASLLCAPAIVRASSLMPVKVVEWTPLALPVSEKPYAGWVERVAYQMMDNAFSICSFTVKSRSGLIVSCARALRSKSDLMWSRSRN